MADKLISVFGATGAQGGGLARAILRDPRGGFAVRAVTRNPTSDKAKALAAQGAEVVAADLDDPASVERALRGAWGAFCLTSYWEHFSAEREIAQARTMARAAAKAGIRHAVWSTFEDTREHVPLDDDRMPTIQGRYKVPHFDGKAEANRFFEESGVPTTYLLTSGYWENLINFGWGPKVVEGGELAVVFPMNDVKMPLIAAEDIGKCVYGIFRRSEKYAGEFVGVAGEHHTAGELAAALSEALGERVAYRNVPPDVFRGFDFPGAAEAGNMFQFWRDFPEVYRGNRSVEESRRLNPELMSLRQWLAVNAGRIPLPEKAT